MNKRRLSASVGADLVRAAERAVAAGRAESVSAWVDEAMRHEVEREERLLALAEFVSAWEAEHGAITQGEMDAAVRATRRRAIIVRGGTASKVPKSAPGKRQAARRSA